MTCRSFRVVGRRLSPSRLLPGPCRAKQTLPAAAAAGLAACILPACGSQAHSEAVQHVAAHGFRFAAPRGWRVQRTRLAVTAARGSDLVQVSTFPLARPYRAQLFRKVAPELRRQLTRAAVSVGGKVEDAGEATVGGVRAHVFRVRVGDHVDEYTFVLVGRREFQLLCRAGDAGAQPCRQLQTSFSLV